jgi:hypothetical protein
MPGKGGGKSGGAGQGSGRGGGMGRGADMGHGRPDSPGRSEQSPGHLKKVAGERSAESFAPGHTRDDVGIPRNDRDEDGEEDRG